MQRLGDAPAGMCDPRFAPVAEAFRENVATRGELGAAIALVVDGRLVVDLWDGWTDEACTRRWQRDTLVDVFSVGKPFAALCVLALAQGGGLDLDAPLRAVWPELHAGDATARMLLAHRAGLPAIEAPLEAGALYDPVAMAAALAAQPPWWEPGHDHGYHVNTFGFLCGELVRRVAGVSLGTFLAREITGPLGADVHVGLPVADQPRCADYLFTDETLASDAPRAAMTPERRLLLQCAYLNPPGISGLGTVNTAAWRAAEIASANCHATARGVAAVYAGLLDATLLAPSLLADATAEASAGVDRVLGRPSRFGLGFQLTQRERPLGPGPAGFGHFGAGGALGFADPDGGVAFGYVMNRGGPRWRNPRNRALIDAIYASL